MIANYINLNHFVEHKSICRYCIDTWKNVGYDVFELNEHNIPYMQHPLVKNYYDQGKYAYCTEILRILLALDHDDFLIMDSDVALFKPLTFGKYDLYIGDYPKVNNITLTNNGTIQYNKYKKNNHLRQILDIYNNSEELNGTIFNMYFENNDIDIYTDYYDALSKLDMGIIQTNNRWIYHEYVRSWIGEYDLLNYLYINTVPSNYCDNHNNYVVYTKWDDILNYKTVSTNLKLVKSNLIYYMPNLKLKDILRIFGIKFDKIIGLNLR